MNVLLFAFLLAGSPVVGYQEFVLDENHENGFGVIRWPVIQDDNPVAERINAVLDYQTVNGETLIETAEIYGEYHAGIVGADFEVCYKDEDYLDIKLDIQFMGAYPSTLETSFLFSLESGERVLPEDLFIPGRMQDLVLLCDECLQGNIRVKIEEDPELETLIDEYHFTMDDLKSAGIREDGMVFHYEFGFPHVILAAEPSGFIMLEWNEVSDYLLPGVRRN